MRVVLFLLWCLRWLPPTWVRALGRGLGSLLFLFGRRRVTLINLRKCFPEWSEAERVRVGREVFRNLSASALELGRLWYAPVDVALANVKWRDFHHYSAWRGKVPIIVFAPHFAGLDFAGALYSRTCAEGFSMYSEQKNKVFDRALRRARLRWNNAMLVTRQQGLRPVLKALKDKRGFYYLPDMDFGARDAVFADFFGVKTATVTAMSRLCDITGAKVVPIIARMTQTGNECGYEVRCYPAWENFPSGNLDEDARMMNAFLEARIREMPEQYFWVHKRFKTRPPGEANFYA
jgi:KDO2-lipid IV(A) lauroyltransferase